MQQTSTKEVQDYTWLGGKSDLQEIVQEKKIWSYFQMVYARKRTRSKSIDA